VSGPMVVNAGLLPASGAAGAAAGAPDVITASTSASPNLTGMNRMSASLFFEADITASRTRLS
jgi:hypothetical protein